MLAKIRGIFATLTILVYLPVIILQIFSRVIAKMAGRHGYNVAIFLRSMALKSSK